MIATAPVFIIVVLTNVDFHSDGVDNYGVIDVVELHPLTSDVKSGLSDRSFYVS